MQGKKLVAALARRCCSERVLLAGVCRYANADGAGMAASKEIAAPVLPAGNVQGKGKVANATPGHLLLGCHAFTLAAIQVLNPTPTVVSGCPHAPAAALTCLTCCVN